MRHFLLDLDVFRSPKRDRNTFMSDGGSMNALAKLRGVGIGAGYFAQFQYEAWARIPTVEIVAVCSRSELKAREVAAAYGISRHYGDWRKALDIEQPDFVDIITPPDSHEEICSYAAERKINIICQKPLARDLESCK